MGRKRARCNHCGTTYTMETGGSTTSLNNHMKVCLQKPKGNTSDIKQLELSFANVGDGPESEKTIFSTWKFDRDAIKKALIHMIVVDELPFRIVEGEGFKQFLSIACPRFHLPSRFTVRRDCLDLFNSMKKSLKNSFEQGTSRMCLTTDTWTSLQRVSYMVLTTHWIDNEWKLQKRIINFCPISAHRGESIGQALEKCIQDWGIERVFTITVDNASANGVVGDGVPTFDYWENVQRIIKILQPFYDLRLKVSGSLHVTAHCFWETLIEIHCLLDEWLNCDDLDIVSMASKMKDKYNKYWGDATNINFLVYLAIILDPRRKMGFVDFGVQQLFPNVASEVMKMVERDLNCLFDEYSSTFGRVQDWLRKSKESINLDGYVAEVQDMEDGKDLF
ncbi:hypothetical protein V6N13_148553 [Hibiscus sabdariffa]